MNEIQEIFRMIPPSYNQSPKVVHQSEHAFDFPTATKTSQRASILGFTFRSTALTMWRDDFRTRTYSSFDCRARRCRRLWLRSIAPADRQQIVARPCVRPISLQQGKHSPSSSLSVNSAK